MSEHGRAIAVERLRHIGLEETDDGVWAIHFNTVLLATLDEQDYMITG